MNFDFQPEQKQEFDFQPVSANKSLSREEQLLKNIGADNSFSQGFVKPVVDLTQNIKHYIDRGADKIFGTKLEAQGRASQQAYNQDYERRFGDSGLANIGEFTGKAVLGAPLGIPVKIMGGLAGNTLGKAATYAAGKLLKNGTTPQELAQNMQAVEGTNTPLGNVVNSPTLQHLQENILAKIPLSGVEKSYQKTSNQIMNRGNNIFNNLFPEGKPSDPGAEIQGVLKEKLNEVQELKRANFANVENLADKFGVKIESNNLQQAAKEALASANRSEKLKNSLDSGFLTDLELAAKSPKEFLNNAGIMETKFESLKDSGIYRGILREKGNAAYADSKDYEAGIYRSLRKALNKDIDSSIEKSAQPALMDAYKKGNEFYAENVAPFEDRDIAKFVRQGGDPDLLLNTFIKSGVNDRGNLTNKLMEKLTPQQQNLVVYGKFAKAFAPDGNIKPQEFTKIYNSLGPKTKDALFSDSKLRKSLDGYATLINKNKEALGAMYNPKTGNRTAELIASTVLGGGAVSLGGLTGFGALATVPAAANIINRLLTSPRVRKLVVGEIQKQNMKGLAGVSKLPNK